MPSFSDPKGDRSNTPRERIRAALFVLGAEHGYEATSIEMIIVHAGVDRIEFDRRFASKDACLDWVLTKTATEYLELTEAAFAAQPTWRDGLRAAGYAALRFFVSDLVRARFFLLESLAGDELIQARRTVFMNTFVDMIDAGRQELDDPDSVSRAKAEAVMGAIYENAMAALRRGDSDAGPQIVQDVMYLAVGAYLGSEAAADEMRRAPAYIAAFKRGET